MDYCEKWRLVALLIGASPLLCFPLAVIVGRLPRQPTWGVLLGTLVGAASAAGLKVASLILWNGLAPANCF